MTVSMRLVLSSSPRSHWVSSSGNRASSSHSVASVSVSAREPPQIAGKFALSLAVSRVHPHGMLAAAVLYSRSSQGSALLARAHVHRAVGDEIRPAGRVRALQFGKDALKRREDSDGVGSPQCYDCNARVLWVCQRNGMVEIAVGGEHNGVLADSKLHEFVIRAALHGRAADVKNRVPASFEP